MRGTRLVIEVDLDAARIAGYTVAQVVAEVAASRPVIHGRLIHDQPRTLETEEGIALARITLQNKAHAPQQEGRLSA
jgi:predicted RecB family endonuclease